MKRNVSARWVAGVASLAAVLTSGCAALDLPRPRFPKSAASESSEPAADDVVAGRRARNAETLRRLRQNRDFAEFQAARFCHRRGDGKACAEGLKRLLARNPDHRDARLLRAELLVEEKNVVEAIENIQYLLDKNPEDSEAHHAIALLLDADGQEAEALVHYEQATFLKPRSEVYRVSYRTAREASQDGGEPEDDAPLPTTPSSTAPAPRTEVVSPAQRKAVSPARSSVARRLAATPDAKPVRPTEASAAPAASQPTTLAAKPNPIRDRGKVDRTDYVESAGPSNVAGQSALSGKRCPSSFPRLQPAPPASAEELLARGKEALSEGNTATALAYFRKAMADNPDDPQIPTSAATAVLRHNHPASAVEILEEAVTVHSESASVQRILALAYYRVGKYTSSQVAAEQALSLDKSNALSYFLVGSALARLGKAEAAEVHFRQARRLDPRFDAAR